MEHIPYGRQKVEQDDIDEVTKVLKSNFLTQGPKIEEFEAKISDLVQAENGVAVNSATSALHIGCLALGLGKGEYLWTSPTTFVASANCGIYCGAKVDFVDIEKNTGLMCTKQLEKKLKIAEKESKLPKIVIPVHLCGTSCDMKRIKELSKQYGFKIIEDASHAIGGSYKGKPVGSCEYSDVTVFSFHPVKIITTGEGGMAMTNSKKLAKKMKLLRSHGITKDKDEFREKVSGPWHYEQQLLGFNYRMNDIEAALGISQANRIKEIVEERNKIRKYYIHRLSKCDLEILEVPANTISSVHLVVARLKNKSPDEHRKIFETLRNAGIGVQLHYSPVHLQPYYRDLGFKKGQYKNAEEYGETAISLPVYPGLKDLELSYICEKICEAVK